MATQLVPIRPSRVERPNESEKASPNRVERVASVGGAANPVNQITNAKNVAKNVFKKRITFNFVCMILVAGTLDIIGMFLSTVPGIGAVISFIAACIFIPWFYFSGIHFNLTKISTMGGTSILEFFPLTGNLPFITINVIYSYYSE